MGMKNSWYSGLATVDLRISGNFPNWPGINKGFFVLPKQKLKSIFFSPKPENLDNPEKLFFPDYRSFPVPAGKNGLQIWNLHPKKH